MADFSPMFGSEIRYLMNASSKKFCTEADAQAAGYLRSKREGETPNRTNSQAEWSFFCQDMKLNTSTKKIKYASCNYFRCIY